MTSGPRASLHTRGRGGPPGPGRRRATHDDGAALVRLRLDAATGVSGVPASLDGFAGHAVTLATELGAPLLPVLDVVGEVRGARRAVAAEVSAALAPVRSVAVALTVLPVGLVPLLARLVGLDLVGFYGHGPGRVVALAVVACWLAGALGVAIVVRAAGRGPSRTSLAAPVTLAVAAGVVVHPLAAVLGLLLVRRRAATPPTGLDDLLELAAVGTSAGLPLGDALRRAAVHADRGRLADRVRGMALALDLGRDAAPTVGPDDGLLPVAELLDDLATSGGPPTAALRATAAELRADQLAAARRRAARLPARLTVPTVLGLLPATVLAVGAPLVAAGLDVL